MGVFFGREAELKRLTEISESAGLAILTGTSGIGKSLLATELVRLRQQTNRRQLSVYLNILDSRVPGASMDVGLQCLLKTTELLQNSDARLRATAALTVACGQTGSGYLMPTTTSTLATAMSLTRIGRQLLGLLSVKYSVPANLAAEILTQGSSDTVRKLLDKLSLPAEFKKRLSLANPRELVQIASEEVNYGLSLQDSTSLLIVDGIDDVWNVDVASVKDIDELSWLLPLLKCERHCLLFVTTQKDKLELLFKISADASRIVTVSGFTHEEASRYCEKHLVDKQLGPDLIRLATLDGASVHPMALDLLRIAANECHMSGRSFDLEGDIVEPLERSFQVFLRNMPKAREAIMSMAATRSFRLELLVEIGSALMYNWDRSTFQEIISLPFVNRIEFPQGEAFVFHQEIYRLTHQLSFPITIETHKLLGSSAVQQLESSIETGEPPYSLDLSANVSYHLAMLKDLPDVDPAATLLSGVMTRDAGLMVGFREAFERFPWKFAHDADFLSNLGLAYSAIGNHEMARLCFDLALSAYIYVHDRALKQPEVETEILVTYARIQALRTEALAAIIMSKGLSMSDELYTYALIANREALGAYRKLSDRGFELASVFEATQINTAIQMISHFDGPYDELFLRWEEANRLLGPSDTWEPNGLAVLISVMGTFIQTWIDVEGTVDWDFSDSDDLREFLTSCWETAANAFERLMQEPLPDEMISKSSTQFLQLSLPIFVATRHTAIRSFTALAEAALRDQLRRRPEDTQILTARITALGILMMIEARSGNVLAGIRSATEALRLASELLGRGYVEIASQQIKSFRQFILSSLHPALRVGIEMELREAFPLPDEKDSRFFIRQQPQLLTVFLPATGPKTAVFHPSTSPCKATIVV